MFTAYMTIFTQKSLKLYMYELSRFEYIQNSEQTSFKWNHYALKRSNYVKDHYLG